MVMVMSKVPKARMTIMTDPGVGAGQVWAIMAR